MDSKIYLCHNIRMDREYVNVLNYTEQQMVNLCDANKLAYANNYSFLRQTNSIFVGFSYDLCQQANYIAFQNPSYSNKWFFAWIDDVIYKSDKNTEIRFTIDAWSTWFDYWTAQKCFVVRHHVNDDTIGLHTVPENIDTGDPVCFYEQDDAGLGSIYWIAMLSSFNPVSNKQYHGISVYNKIPFAKQVHLFRIFSTEQRPFGGYDDLEIYIRDVNKKEHIGDISDLFIVPDALIDYEHLTQQIGTYTEEDDQGVEQSYSYTFYYPRYSIDVDVGVSYINKLYTFSDYQPKNNKCLVYPYNFCQVSNNIGNTNIYKYEDFSDQFAPFRRELSFSIGCSGRLIPINYKKIGRNYDESLPLGKYPTCSWSADSFTNWLTQNGINIATKLTTSTIASAGQMLAGNYGGGIMSLATTEANMLGEFNKAILSPNIEYGGSNLGDVNFSAETNTFTIRSMRIKKEYLQIIDDFFTRRGYKINKIETPNITGRTYWNYIEIGANDCIGYGSVPEKYMNEINRACRRGTTVWHNHSNLGNYNLNNTIVS